MLKKIIHVSAAMLLGCLPASGCGYIKEKAYSGWNREEWQQKDRVVQVLKIEPGQKIADIGAGAGYFTFSLAESVGDSGIVYAVDVDSDMIHMLEKKIIEKKVANVIPVKAAKDDSGIPDKEVNLIFLSNTYHEIYDRVNYFEKLRNKLSDGGKIAVIDLKPHGSYGLFGMHGTETEVIVNELQQAGYQLDQSFDFLPEQYFMVFSISHTTN